MITNEAIQKNKFYIGSNSVFDRNWGHKTIEDALTHAKGMITLEGKDEVFIVKIVKVVRKKQAPIEIVTVR